MNSSIQLNHIVISWSTTLNMYRMIGVLQEMTMLAMSVVTESLFGINFRDRETFSKVSGAFTNILEHFTQVNEPVKNLLD